MTSVNLKDRWGIQRTGQLCSEIFNDKLSRALQYTVNYSIYDAELTIRELTTSQSLLLSLFYGLLHQDVTFCLNLIEASSASVQLNSSYIKIWLKDDFFFKHDDVAKTFSNLAELLDCKFPSQLKLPQCIAVAFSGLVDKYKLLEVFNLSGDKKALEFVKALNSFVFGLTKNAELTLENNRESAGSELDEVELVSTPTKSNELEENTNGFLRSVVNDQEAVVELPTSVSNGVEPTLSSSQPELPTSDGDVAEPALSSSQPEIGDGASGSSKPTSTLPLSESQTNAINVEEPTLTLSESEIGNEVSIFPSVDSVPRLSINKDDMKSCLEIAVRHNDHTTISNLLDFGLNVNEETESGQRLLHLAVYSGCTETVSTLLSFGALPGLKNKDFITPLQLAVQLNTPTIIELLLRNGADVNQQFGDGNSPLHKTASTGTLEALNTLLRFKPELDLKNNDGYTALHLATKAEHLYVMQALIRAGAAVNLLSKEKESCLHFAVENGNIESINILMKALANPYLKQKSGLNSFHLTPNTNILNSFVTQGVSVNTRTSKEDTLLHLVAFKGNMELAKRLIELHAIINATNKEKNTPLIKAIEGGHAAMVRLLINAGAHVNYVNPLTRDAAIHLAAETGKIECVRLLLEAGVDVNMRGGKKWAPIHNAAQGGYSSIVSLLIEKGADVNLRTEDNDTPLHWAACNGFHQTAEILIDNGADINAKGDFGDTPLRVATGCKKRSVIKLLKKKGAIL